MIVLDLETSGLNPKEHGILSIGAVDFDNQDNTFYGECKLKENDKTDYKALEVNGFTEEQIKNQTKNCEELLREFLKWCQNIEDITIAGQNVQFDISFLQENFKIFNLPWIFGYKIVDLHSVIYFHYMTKKLEIPLKYNKSVLNLDTILAFLSIQERKGYHNALQDAKLTAKAFTELLNKN